MIFVITCHCMDYVLCCTLSAMRNQSTANICRPYSSIVGLIRNTYFVTIRKRKISYFILNISMTLLVCRSIALTMLELCMHIQHINNKSDLIRSFKFRETYNTRHYYSATHWIHKIFSNIHKHDVSIHTQHLVIRKVCQGIM